MIDVTSLYDISKQIVDIVKGNYIKDGMLPQGKLANFSWNVDFNGTLFQLQFMMPPEWKWVEIGRKPSAKMPPVDAIEQWIRVRRLVPRAKNGKTPTTRGLAFAIAKKIQREGFYSPGHQGKHTIERSMEEAQPYIMELCNKMTEMMNKEVTGDLIQIFDGLSSFTNTTESIS